MALSPVPLQAALSLCLLAGRAGIAWQIALLLLQGLLPLCGLLAMRWLIDAVALGAAGQLAAADAAAQVSLAVAVAAAVGLAGVLVQALRTHLAEAHGRALTDACVARVEAKAASLDAVQFDQPAVHELLQLAGQAAGQRPIRLVQDLGAFLVALVSLLAMSSVLLGAAPWLPLLVATAAVPIALARLRAAKAAFALQQEQVQTQRVVAYQSGLLTTRGPAKEVRVQQLAPSLRSRLDDQRRTLRQRALQHLRWRLQLDGLVQSVAQLAVFAAYLWLGHEALQGAISIGGLVLYAQAAQRAQNGVRDVLGAAAGIAEHRLFLQPLVGFLALAPRIVAPAAPLALPPGPLPVRCARVSFRYPGAASPALQGIDVELRPGERVALLGRNGSGKSTLLHLLARLHDPSAGAVCAAGIDLRQCDPRDWQARLAVLLQDGLLFETSLRDNLCGDAPVDAQRTAQVFAAVGLDAWLAGLPQGLDTPVGRRLADGIEPSGGQRRRLLLARALLRRADLMLLDEPCASLEPGAEAAVFAALRALAGAATVVVAEHRPAVLAWADRVLVVDAGRLVADGTPGALAAQPEFAWLFAPPHASG